MLSLLGEARIVDDPGPDWSMTLDPRQYHLANFGHDLLVGPAALPDKMQQRLMLRRCSPRRRDRRHRFNALASDRHHQACAIVTQWAGTIRVPDHAHKSIDVVPKPPINALRFPENHLNPLDLNGNCLHYVILISPTCDFLTQSC
jgi:hypothetical protein